MISDHHPCTIGCVGAREQCYLGFSQTVDTTLRVLVDQSSYGRVGRLSSDGSRCCKQRMEGICKAAGEVGCVVRGKLECVGLLRQAASVYLRQCAVPGQCHQGIMRHTAH